MAGLTQSLQLAPFIFGIALGHAVVLGLPLFLLFRTKGWVNFYSSTISGFVIGAIPGGVVSWPSRYTGPGSFSSVDGVPTMIDGVPTLAGWMNYVELLLVLGSLGALSGLVFWLVLQFAGRKPNSDNIPPPAPSPIPRLNTRAAALAGVSLALAAFVIAIPTIMEDRTCHNMFRDRRTSAAPRVASDLNIPRDEWPALTRIFAELGAEHDLSFRDSSIHRPGLEYLVLSLCNESGVNVSAMQMQLNGENAPARGISVGLYLLTDDAEWRPVAQSLIGRIEAAWPGKLQISGPGGETVPPPPELLPLTVQ